MRLLSSFGVLLSTALVAVLPSIAMADPVTIGFEGVAPDNSSVVTSTPYAYTESGYSFNASTSGGTAGIFGKFASNSNGSATFVFCSFDSGCTDGTSVTLTGTTPFSLNSIDVGNWMTGQAAGSLELIGHLLGGGTVTTTLGTGNAWSSNLLSGFDNLQSVEFRGHTTYAVAFDNLVISAGTVPEPASLALVGLALAGMGFAARRKRA